MKKIWTRETALEKLLERNGGFKAGTCKETNEWYVKNDCVDLRDFILTQTSFLIDVSFHERMVYFKRNLTSVMICNICSSTKLQVVLTKNSFQKCCSSKSCR